MHRNPPSAALATGAFAWAAWQRLLIAVLLGIWLWIAVVWALAK
jgi:hypothetical protein